MVRSSESTGFSAKLQNCKNRVDTNDWSTKHQKRSESKLVQRKSSGKGIGSDIEKGQFNGCFQDSSHHKMSENSSIRNNKLKIRPENERHEKDSNSGQEMRRTDDDEEVMSESCQEAKNMANQTFSVPDPAYLMAFLYGESENPVFLSANHEFEKTPTGNKENLGNCGKRGGGFAEKKKNGKKIKGLSGGFEGSEQCHNGKRNGKNKNEKFYNRSSNIGCLAYP